MREKVVQLKKEYPDAKSGAAKTLLFPNSSLALSSSVTYLTVTGFRTHNIGVEGLKALKRVYIHISYGKWSCTSKTTTDLSMTKG